MQQAPLSEDVDEIPSPAQNERQDDRCKTISGNRMKYGFLSRGKPWELRSLGLNSAAPRHSLLTQSSSKQVTVHIYTIAIITLTGMQ